MGSLRGASVSTFVSVGKARRMPITGPQWMHPSEAGHDTCCCATPHCEKAKGGSRSDLPLAISQWTQLVPTELHVRRAGVAEWHHVQGGVLPRHASLPDSSGMYGPGLCRHGLYLGGRGWGDMGLRGLKALCITYLDDVVLSAMGGYRVRRAARRVCRVMHRAGFLISAKNVPHPVQKTK